MAKISFVVPVYNVEKYLKKCLNSLLNQTIEDIEIICIDDASPDGCRDVLIDYQKKDSRIKCIFHAENSGQAISRNEGIELAEGEYVAFVDPDDYIEATSYQKVVELADQKDLEICFFKYREIYENDKIPKVELGKIKNMYQDVYYGRTLLKAFVENRDFFYYPCMALFKTSFLQRNQLAFPKLHIGEGGMFMLNALVEARRVGVSEEIAYNYLQRETSVMHTNGYRRRLLFGQIYQYVNMLQKTIGMKETEGLVEFLEYQKEKIHGGIQTSDANILVDIEKDFDDVFSKEIIKLLKNHQDQYKICLSEKDIFTLKENKRILIYGAGYATPDVIRYLNEYMVEIIGIVVSNRENNPQVIYGHRVYEIHQLKDLASEVLVIVAANKKYHKAIEETLDELSFEKKIFIDILI